ncbi:MAG: MFS transporter [Nitrospina sp.]|nr:MFS transporter [Nitrospina sp.]
MNTPESGRPTETPIGYLSLLKQNSAFRNLWYGQVISELGNWINSIALYALILQLTGSGMAMAAAMMAKLLPMVIISPFAGVVIDRIDRKKVLIASDILRCFTVLGFLIVDSREDLWIVYTLTLFEVALTGFFEPARSAILPSIVEKNHLVTANALSGSTWSIMLTLGAALGGFVVSFFGIKTAFILDALTYLLSAWFIIKISYPNTKYKERIKKQNSSGIKGLVEGLRYLISHPTVLVFTLLKSGMAIKGGIMTLIPLFASRLWSDPSAVSMAVGILFSSRGIGSAIGPVLIRKWLGESPKTLKVAILAAFFLGSFAILVFSFSKNIWTASLSIGLSGMSGSIVWVFSTALIHLEADRKFLGRIFGIEMALLTLIMGISNGLVGVTIDKLQITIQSVILWMSGIYMIPGILWILFLALRVSLKKS